MKLYLVRHGQTGFNAEGVFQDAHSNLSETGLKQARALARRFTKISIDLIFCSSMPRAKQTAEEIAKVTNKKVTLNDNLREVKHPSQILSLSYADPEVARIRELQRQKADDKDWHYSDEENYIDIRTRVVNFLRSLDQFEGKNVLAVSHSRLIKTLLTVAMFGKQASSEQFYSVYHFFQTDNTGISVVEKKEGKWKLHILNDKAHLG